MKFGKYSTIKIPNIFDDIFYKSENIYSYTDKYDNVAFKSINLYINSVQKELVDILFTKYNININGHKVTRAFLKMTEIITETNLVNKLQMTGFHICEAPGNFVAALENYSVNKIKYEWNAQSLAEDKADFYDTYGFIKANATKYDLADGSGDIMRENNMLYYLNKYKNVDILTGDCWLESNEDLCIYQLLYSMLFPKQSGSAVIKTIYTFTNNMYLSLLYVFLSVFEESYLLKSNQNFWSPEIYIIGKGHRGLSDHNKNILLEIFHAMNKNEKIYPVQSVPNTFCQYYKDIISKVHEIHANSRLFFVFAYHNRNIFENNKQYMKNIIRKKNLEWIDKYVKKI
jgi:hypothetical protein